MSVSRGAGGFQSHDQLRPASVETYDFGGDFNRVIAYDGTFAASDYGFDADNVWTDGALVDAHDYLGWTYDFYFKQFGRKSWDDQNHAIQTIVHPLSRDHAHDYGDDVFGQFVDNAFYSSGAHVMVFGDGDGNDFTYFSASLDVAAHEFTHGVTDYTSQLEYHDQSGALNESFSDIMGTSAEFFFGQQGVTPHPPNWLIGEDITLTSPGFGRSLADPTRGPLNPITSAFTSLRWKTTAASTPTAASRTTRSISRFMGGPTAYRASLSPEWAMRTSITSRRSSIARSRSS